MKDHKTIEEQHAEDRRRSKCPVCGKRFVRKKDQGESILYIHEEKDGPMGTNLITDSCKFDLRSGGGND